MAAARSRDPVLAKIRLIWVLMVWLLRNSCSAISGLVSPAGDQAEDLDLALRQAVGRRYRLAGSLPGLGWCHGGLQERSVHARVQDGQSAGRRA